MEYGAVLKATQQQVTSFEQLFDEVATTTSHLTKERLIEVLTHLKQAKIIYFNADYSNVVSLINL